MSTTINPEITSLRERIEAQSREIAELRGNIQQLDKIVSATTRQSIWQLIVLVVSLCGAIVGGLAYQTTMIDKRIEQIEKRIELSDKNFAARIESSEKNLAARIESSEKNLAARFEDLKQEVRAQRK